MDKTAIHLLSQRADRRPFLLPVPERRLRLDIPREFHLLEPEAFANPTNEPDRAFAASTLNMAMQNKTTLPIRSPSPPPPAVIRGAGGDQFAPSSRGHCTFTRVCANHSLPEAMSKPLL